MKNLLQQQGFIEDNTSGSRIEMSYKCIESCKTVSNVLILKCQILHHTSLHNPTTEFLSNMFVNLLKFRGFSSTYCSASGTTLKKMLQNFPPFGVPLTCNVPDCETVFLYSLMYFYCCMTNKMKMFIKSTIKICVNVYSFKEQMCHYHQCHCMRSDNHT